MPLRHKKLSCRVRKDVKIGFIVIVDLNGWNDPMYVPAVDKIYYKSVPLANVAKESAVRATTTAAIAIECYLFPFLCFV
jgi:hypothetical protein